MAMKNHGRDHNDKKENDSGRRQYTQGNQKKHNTRERSCLRAEKKRMV